MGLWHMDESSGSTMNDSSTHDNDGKLEHALLPERMERPRVFVQRIQLAGLIPNHASLNPGTADIVLSAYINVTTKPAGRVRLRHHRKKGQGRIYKMEILYTRLYAVQGQPGNGVVKGGPVVTDGRWHHLECRKTSNRVAPGGRGRGEVRIDRHGLDLEQHDLGAGRQAGPTGSGG